MLGPSIFGRGIAAIGDDSSNRQMLLDLCVANDLLVANTWFHDSFRPNLKVHSYCILPHSDLTTGGTLFSLRLQSVEVWFEPSAVV